MFSGHLNIMLSGGVVRADGRQIRFPNIDLFHANIGINSVFDLSNLLIFSTSADILFRVCLNFYHLAPSGKFNFSQRYIFRRNFRLRLQNMPCPKLNFLTFAQT